MRNLLYAALLSVAFGLGSSFVVTFFVMPFLTGDVQP